MKPKTGYNSGREIKVQTHQIVCIKYVQIFVYQLYVNKAA